MSEIEFDEATGVYRVFFEWLPFKLNRKALEKFLLEHIETFDGLNMDDKGFKVVMKKIPANSEIQVVKYYLSTLEESEQARLNNLPAEIDKAILFLKNYSLQVEHLDELVPTVKKIVFNIPLTDEEKLEAIQIVASILEDKH